MSESNQEWRLPKNIRQIGDGSGEKKIYVEDYAVTYLNRLGQGEKPGKAILFGEVKSRDGCPYIFADGALEVQSFYMDEGARETLLEKMRTYFGGKRVVGWFLASEESPFVVTREVVEIFEREFPGDDQILLVRDCQENEMAVFTMEEEVLTEQPGYYIYYDKNTMMQEFMISDGKGKSVDEEEEVKDDAIKAFRRIIKSKKPGKMQEEQKQAQEAASETIREAEKMEKERKNKKIRMTAAKRTANEKETADAKKAANEKGTVDTENAAAKIAEKEKKAQEEAAWRQKFKPGRIGYLAGGFMAMTVLALGITMIYNYDRMKEVERSLARLTNNVDSQREYVTDDAGDATQVMLHIEEETAQGEADPASVQVSGEECTAADGEAQSAAARIEEADDKVQSAKEERSDGLEAESTDQTTAGQTSLNQMSGQSADPAAEQAAEVQDGADETAKETVQTASAAPRASYIVKVGDTLAGISEMYYGNLDKVTEICSLNGITDENTILPGQKILLP